MTTNDCRSVHLTASVILLCRWAWCSVNTRSVFMSHPPNTALRGQDVYALAPFLDLLNHRPDVQVNCCKHGQRHYCGFMTIYTTTPRKIFVSFRLEPASMK